MEIVDIYYLKLIGGEEILDDVVTCVHVCVVNAAETYQLFELLNVIYFILVVDAIEVAQVDAAFEIIDFNLFYCKRN